MKCFLQEVVRTVAVGCRAGSGADGGGDEEQLQYAIKFFLSEGALPQTSMHVSNLRIHVCEAVVMGRFWTAPSMCTRTLRYTPNCKRGHVL